MVGPNIVQCKYLQDTSMHTLCNIYHKLSHPNNENFLCEHYLLIVIYVANIFHLIFTTLQKLTCISHQYGMRVLLFILMLVIWFQTTLIRVWRTYQLCRNKGCAKACECHRKGVAPRLVPSPSWLGLTTSQHITKWALLDLPFIQPRNSQPAPLWIQKRRGFEQRGRGRIFLCAACAILSNAPLYRNIFLHHCIQ